MNRAYCIWTSWLSRQRARRARAAAAAAAVDRAVESTVEMLESRRMYSVTATSAGGVLTVLGDNGANAITVSRDVAGNLRVNGGTVPIAGAPATVASIQ